MIMWYMLQGLLAVTCGFCWESQMFRFGVPLLLFLQPRKGTIRHFMLLLKR